MNNVEAIAGNKYNFGFLLSESELRRIVELTKEQLLKIDSNYNNTEEYQIIYANGTIAK